MSDNISNLNVLQDLGCLYHNYSFFGVDNKQISRRHVLNQKAKEPIIIAYIAYAIAKSKTKISEDVSFAELFCADGFYAMVAMRMGCSKSIGIDNNRDKLGYFDKAKLIAERLNLDRVEFIEEEITPNLLLPSIDIVANVGGLYHVGDPKKILELSYKMANKYLIVQSVISLATNDENYFQAPAPRWTWGNRFSQQSFDKMIKSICPKIVDQYFNELDGNKKLKDRGSVYYLIEK